MLYNYPDVLEAVRRLPPEIQDERNYRLIRAVQLSLERIRLPEEQWTKYEDVRYTLSSIQSLTEYV